jgi:hypothetical protein
MSDAQVKGITRTKVAGQTKTQDQVRVLYGVHSLEADLAGRTVADVRQALRQALNISPQAVALVDGREVEEASSCWPGSNWSSSGSPGKRDT